MNVYDYIIAYAIALFLICGIVALVGVFIAVVFDMPYAKPGRWVIAGIIGAVYFTMVIFNGEWGWLL